MNSAASSKSLLIEDFSNYNWVKKDSEIITYNGVINYERAGKKEPRHCVMCGILEDGHNCVIPNQNKDVCRKCDSSYWLLKEFNVVIKFCKGKQVTQPHKQQTSNSSCFSSSVLHYTIIIITQVARLFLL
jgi:hypothetical protein